MAYVIKQGVTIIDFLNLCIEFSALKNEPTVCVSLNKGEWTQLLALIRADYNESNQFFTPDAVKLGTLKFKNIDIFWDGTESVKFNYMDDMRYLKTEIDAIHQLAQQGNQIQPRNPVPNAENVNTPRRANARGVGYAPPAGYTWGVEAGGAALTLDEAARHFIQQPFRGN
jgi:hypothetical protein